ncbi:MAG: 30S ribosomal protein S7 [Candidatus Altiarchaeales archaeon]|nr:30S ribosomal protein S7 [Candidatus Altiarchaeales archaeon]MBD3416350.1 30S ribosomal protein S7 [Candidatus Altiarchaeales archaeon]
MKLFGRWEYDITLKDKGMARYINLTPVHIPHTAGRMVGKQFSKSKMNIVERLVNKMMRSGQGTRKVAGKYIRGSGNTGKKMNALNIVEKAFEIVEKRTKKNPLQVLVDAIQASGPREETTTIIYGGIRYHQAVDVSTQRRVDFALKYLSLGAFATAFSKDKPIEECLADEIIWASKSDTKSYAIQRKEETERIAHSAR